MALYLDSPIEGVIVEVGERSGIVEFVLDDKEGLARVTRAGFRRNGFLIPPYLSFTTFLKVGQTVDLVNLKANRCFSDEEKGIHFYADVHVIDPPVIKKPSSGLPTQYYKNAPSDIDKSEDTRSWKNVGSLESLHTEKTSSSTNDLPSTYHSSGPSVRGRIEPPATGDVQGTPSAWKIHTVTSNKNLPAEKVTTDQGTQTISTGEIVSSGIYTGKL